MILCSTYPLHGNFPSFVFLAGDIPQRVAASPLSSADQLPFILYVPPSHTTVSNLFIIIRSTGLFWKWGTGNDRNGNGLTHAGELRRGEYKKGAHTLFRFARCCLLLFVPSSLITSLAFLLFLEEEAVELLWWDPDADPGPGGGENETGELCAELSPYGAETALAGA